MPPRGRTTVDVCLAPEATNLQARFVVGQGGGTERGEGRGRSERSCCTGTNNEDSTADADLVVVLPDVARQGWQGRRVATIAAVTNPAPGYRRHEQEKKKKRK